MEPLRLLDLFSGIGGFSLGLERSGFFETVAFCEIESFPRRVLKKHWPDVPIYEDVRILTAARLAADGIAVDAICGGFPCQDISVAGKGAGLAGARSGLWSEYARIIGELRPRVVIVENVAVLLGRGFDRVLGDLASLGYDAEWHCIPASVVGAPHRRDRLWIVAYPKSSEWGPLSQPCDGLAQWEDGIFSVWQKGPSGLESGSEDVADAECGGLQRESGAGFNRPGRQAGILTSLDQAGRGGWLSEPDVGRVANGVPSRVDRLKGLGNAVVPQIPELIGGAIGAVPAQR